MPSNPDSIVAPDGDRFNCESPCHSLLVGIDDSRMSLFVNLSFNLCSSVSSKQLG